MGFHILISFAAGVVYEWLMGPEVDSMMALGGVAIRTVCATMLALVVVETAHILYRAAMALDGRPFAQRRK